MRDRPGPTRPSIRGESCASREAGFNWVPRGEHEYGRRFRGEFRRDWSDEGEPPSKGYSQFRGFNDAVLVVVFGLRGDDFHQIAATVKGWSVGPPSQRPMQTSVARDAL